MGSNLSVHCVGFPHCDRKINLSKVHNVNCTDIDIYITLSQVFRVAYCEEFDPNNADNVRTICQAFVTSICDYNPEMLRKPKIHSILHLSDNMMDFGPTAVCNAEVRVQK